MDWFTGIIVYLMIFWTFLFCVLPFGVRQGESKPAAHGPGAPVKASMKKRFLVTAIGSIIIWIVVYILVDHRIIDFRQIAEGMQVQDKT
tara:strand:- start:724 stop:990 length:267 start_codon:yes stop_codon:yes gene_type:complete